MFSDLTWVGDRILGVLVGLAYWKIISYIVTKKLDLDFPIPTFKNESINSILTMIMTTIGAMGYAVQYTWGMYLTFIGKENGMAAVLSTMIIILPMICLQATMEKRISKK